MSKIKVVSIIVLFLLLKKSFAQNLEFEVLLKPALTSLRGNQSVKDYYDPTINFSAGAGVNCFLKDNSIISLFIFYDKKGGRDETRVVIRDPQNYPVADATMLLESNFNYISIPIQWGRRFGEKIKYQFGIGVYAAYLLKQEQIAKGLDGFGFIDITEDRTDSYTDFDFGLSASFSMYVPINDSFSVKVGFDDNFGLITTSEEPLVDDGTIKHNSFGAVIGVNLRLK